MPAIIEAKEQSLDKVFSNDYVFEIPIYQRPYAWTTEQVEELLDDLTNAMDRDSEAPYFLGSIVIIKHDGGTASQVVDGQQRLTTLTLLLCVLRYLSGDPETIKGLDRRIREVGDVLSNTEDRFRLSLRERDREFFKNNVQDGGSLDHFLGSDTVNFSDSQKQILENAKYLCAVLGQHNEERRRALATYITQHCELVVVSASDGKSAHRIFAVMNDRGLDLSPTDILKPEVLDKVPRGLQEAYADKWEGIEAELGRDGFKDLFAYIRMIYGKKKQQETVQEEFRESVLSEVHGQAFVDNVLEPYAKMYGIVSNASYESTADAEKVNAPLQHLGRLDNSDWIPPTMAYFLRHEDQRDNLAHFTRDMERLAYSLFIRRANVNERINRYADVLNSIENDENLFLENSPPLQLSLEEKLNTLQELDGDIYSHIRVRMPLLLRLDSLLAEGGVSHQPRVISIEHVLPQSPTDCSQWKQWFPDDDERIQWTHRLANLVLLSRRKNSQASNYEFERKKNEYFQKNGVTTFALTTKVVTECEWTLDVLKRRQRELINALKKEWRLG